MIYDYRCPTCKLDFEYMHSMNEKPPVPCPFCGTLSTKVFIHMPPVVWGTGFAGSVKPRIDWGKQDKDVCYPDGHIRHKRWNELYEDGGL